MSELGQIGWIDLTVPNAEAVQDKLVQLLEKS